MLINKRFVQVNNKVYCFRITLKETFMRSWFKTCPMT